MMDSRLDAVERKVVDLQDWTTSVDAQLAEIKELLQFVSQAVRVFKMQCTCR